MGNAQQTEAIGPTGGLENGQTGSVQLNPVEYLSAPVGYRVLSVQSNSPCSNLGFVAFFDFIVAANGIPLRTLDTTFIELIKGSEDRPLPLAVYNTKNATLREIIVTPSRKWPGEGMLGLTIRFDTFAHSDESVIHVLEVEHDSPAEIAGLQPDSDYLLGTAEKIFQDTDVLFLELQTHLERPVEFFVYNAQQDDVRIVVLMPTEEWGGEGILGASVGHGYLHMLPAAACQTTGHSAESIGNRAANSAFGFNTSGAMDMAAHGAAPAGAAGAAVAVVAVQDTSVATVPAAPTDHSTAATHSPSLVPPV